MYTIDIEINVHLNYKKVQEKQAKMTSIIIIIK